MGYFFLRLTDNPEVDEEAPDRLGADLALVAARVALLGELDLVGKQKFNMYLRF